MFWNQWLASRDKSWGMEKVASLFGGLYDIFAFFGVAAQFQSSIFGSLESSFGDRVFLVVCSGGACECHMVAEDLQENHVHHFMVNVLPCLVTFGFTPKAGHPI